MATSSALYSEQMKNLFGFTSTGPNSPVRNLRLTRESIEKMEEDQLNATHDQLDVQEEQLKVLKKIARELARGGGTGGFGSGGIFGKLAEGYLGFKGLKALWGGVKGFGKGAVGFLPSVARQLPKVLGGLFTGATASVLAWGKSVTGGVLGALSASKGLIGNMRIGMAGKVRAAVTLLSGTILSSVSGVLNSIANVIRSGLNFAKTGISKLAGKLMLPLTAAFAAYEGYNAYNKASTIDKNNRLGKLDKGAIGVAGAVDSVLLNVPSAIQQQITGEDFVTANTRRLIEERERRAKGTGVPTLADAIRKKEVENALRQRKFHEGGGWHTPMSYLQKQMGWGAWSSEYDNTASVGIIAEKAATEAIDKTKSSVFSVTSPATNKTYSYFEVMTGLLATQVDLLKDAKDIAKKQLNVANDALKDQLGINLLGSAEDVAKQLQEMYGSGYTGTIGSHSADTSSGYTTHGAEASGNAANGNNYASSGVESLPNNVLSNQIMPTPSITTTEMLNGELQTLKEASKFSITDPNILSANNNGEFTTLKANATDFSTNPQAIQSIVEANDGKRGITMRMADGSLVKRVGARNWRNNNPGNIEYGKFAKAQGAIGSDGRFAIFPDYKSGRTAKEKLLFESAGYKGMNISQAIHRYAPPTENNTAAYIKSVADALGINANTPLSSLTPEQRSTMLDAMEKVEGFREGTTTVIEKGTGLSSTTVNPRLMQPELTGDLSVKLPQFGAVGLDANGVVNQKQAKVAGIRKMAITPSLEQKLAEASLMTLGPDYRIDINSGGQPKKGTRGRRTGTTAHDLGHAADFKIINKKTGEEASEDAYSRLAQGWLASKTGGASTRMGYGGIHLDEHRTRTWNYGDGLRPSAQFRDRIARGLKGEHPEYVMSREEARNLLKGEAGKQLIANTVKAQEIIQEQSLKEVSKGARGLGRLLSHDKFAARMNPEEKKSIFDTTIRPSGIDLMGRNGDISALTTSQAQMLKTQGIEIAKGMVAAERELPRQPDFNPQIQSNSILNAAEGSPISNSLVANNPTGSSIDSSQLMPRDIPHMDELNMLMANSQMMG